MEAYYDHYIYPLGDHCNASEALKEFCEELDSDYKNKISTIKPPQKGEMIPIRCQLSNGDMGGWINIKVI